MTSGPTAKIRLVRCPKCRRILPELPDVPVYKCGSCGTHLKAKILTNDVKSTADLRETDTGYTNKLDHACEDKKSSSSSHDTIPQLQGECSLVEKNARDIIISSSCESEELSGINLTDEDQNNGSAHNEPGDFDDVQHADANFLNKYLENGSDEYKSGEFDDETLGDIKFSDRDQNQSDQNDSPCCKNEQPRIINEVSSSIKLACLENKESFQLGGGNSMPKSNNESSTSAAAKEEVESYNDSDSSFGRTETWNIVDTQWSTSINDTRSPARKSTSSDVPLASADVQLKQPVQITNHLPDYVRSQGAFGKTEFVNPSSELSDALINLSKSPTTRSSRAYYDDGISSCEETDGQLSNQNKYSFKSAHKPVISATCDERHQREKFLASSNYEIKNQLKDYALSASEMAFNDRKSTGLDRDNLLKSTSFSHQLGNRRRFHRNEYSSQLPFCLRDSVSGFGSEPSNQLHDEFHCQEGYNSQEKLMYTQQEKLKLLRMVQELQDQLSKSYSPDEKPNGRASASSWKDQRFPYYDGMDLKERSYHNFNCYKYPAGTRGEDSWPQGSKSSGMPFSAEATHFWQQADHSLHCCPQDWQPSAEIPGSCLHHNSGFSRAHSGINFYNFCGSCPTSPQQCVDSEFSIYSHGAKSDAQRHRSHEVQKYSREKPHLAKRHIRPMAAGSPFITCTQCFKVLHLPADFLLSNKRCHQLRCGACLAVLKFTLLNRKHLLPYSPTAKAPPPSEVDKYSVATDRIIVCSCHSSECPHVGPVSFSSDYDNGKTLHTIHCNAIERNLSHGLVDHDKGRKKIMNDPRNKHKIVVEAYDSASSSLKKGSPDAEENHDGESSPLHRLMGYSSASELIYSRGPSSSPEDLGNQNIPYHAGKGSRQRI